MTDPFGCTHKIVANGQKLEQSVVHRDGFFGGQVTTPDQAAFAVTDLDIRFKFKADSWHPGFTQWFVGQGLNSDSTLAWVVSQHSNGRLRTAYTTNGSTILGPESTVSFDVADGSWHVLRSTVDTNDGAGNRITSYFESFDEGLSWVPIGTPISEVGAITLFNSSKPLSVPGETATAAGACAWIDWRDGINSPTSVVKADFTQLEPGTTGFTDETLRVWTVNGITIFNPVIVGKCFV